MNVFKLRERVLGDYKSYVESFLNIRDPHIADFVSAELEKGVFWPDSSVQLNPSYKMGGTVGDLVATGTLHNDCKRIFQRNGEPFKLYEHQDRAIQVAGKKESCALTTGTGSGKSLAYLVPIIDHILRNPGQDQVRAIIVYPMNALINSQQKAVDEMLDNLGADRDRVRCARYTGQESQDEKAALREHPPHIMLTNYVMLELMMSRPRERVFLDRTVAKLEFLVLDELHTYTGRQGADVSMLVRRVRQRCGNANLLCIGTSATMVSGGTREEQLAAVANVASKIFGSAIKSENVIDEGLRRSITYTGEVTGPVLAACLKQDVPGDYAGFIASPLAAWIENTFGLEKHGEVLRRRRPITLSEGAEVLAGETGSPNEACQKKIEQFLHKGSALRHDDGTPVFAVRLHQFISQGDSVYASLEPSPSRYLTLTGQRYAKGKEGQDKMLAPLVFCRTCGQEYYLLVRDEKEKRFNPAISMFTLYRREVDPGTCYLLIDTNREEPAWSDEREEELPDNWLTKTKSGSKVKSQYAAALPKRCYVSTGGGYQDVAGPDLTAAWTISHPFLLCPCCGSAYDGRTKEFTKLAALSGGSRSSATTLVSLSTVSQLQQDSEVHPSARKILSFTDNRQDASLQAGHFNDFIDVGMLRGAICRALQANKKLDYKNVAEEVVKALDLPPSAYAQNPGGIGLQPQKNREALTDYIEYCIYHDLRRGWRVVQPNLEQCGLLRIDYPELEKVCYDDLWNKDEFLAGRTPDERYTVCRNLLDHLRKSLAIDAGCLQGQKQTRLKREVSNTLKPPWNFDEDERLALGGWFAYGDAFPGADKLTPKSVIGRYLISIRAWPGLAAKLDYAQYEKMLKLLLDILNQGGYVRYESRGDSLAVQLKVDSMHWVLGDGVPPQSDPVRDIRLISQAERDIQKKANSFFTELYLNGMEKLKHMEGREHTGQTSREDREKREKAFSEGQLSCLFCSPTMELGIDIADLNTVNMRNIPPTPANYAQRSGRAGRSGQPAFITAYCSQGSGHDQYFFERKQEMVSGVVEPPRLDLANEELVKSHLHAVWLAATGLDLRQSIIDLVNAEADGIPLTPDIEAHITLSEEKVRHCIVDCKQVLSQCAGDLGSAAWYSDSWVEGVVRSSPSDFRKAFDRWRELHNAAYYQMKQAMQVQLNAHLGTHTADEKLRAQQRQIEAGYQLDLLANRINKEDSDFYPYRYLASEGFLPGYNFPRLPVRAFIPRKTGGDYLSRPRFLAISEFGPRNVLYQEGRKYRVVRSIISGDVERRFTSAKICNLCGAIHESQHAEVDKCQVCNCDLAGTNFEKLDNLFEMTTVSTYPAERINCDEEERVREGYEITTHYRFDAGDGKVRKLDASVTGANDQEILRLTYGPSANIWRINRTWRRSTSQGFSFDMELGIWGKKQGEITEDNAIDAAGHNMKSGVHIYVRDYRNVLLVRPSIEAGIDEVTLANLQHALQKGICAAYQVDDDEIGSQRVGQGAGLGILFWEAAEGGVGVLERIVAEPRAVHIIAAKALELCHYDPATGVEDQKKLQCGRACYRCLLTYRNQVDHKLLDRYKVQGLLLQLAGATTQLCAQGRNYKEHYRWLREQTDNRSRLEKDLLDLLYRQGRRLPDHAQKLIQEPMCVPDFFYDDGYVCVFCDGNVHDPAEQREKDQIIRGALVEKGLRVVVVRYDHNLEELVAQHGDVFREGWR